MENEKEKYQDNSVSGTGGWDVSVSSAVREESPVKEELPEEVHAAPGQPEDNWLDTKVRYPVWVITLAVIGVFFVSQLIAYLVTLAGVPQSAGGLTTFVSFTLTLGITIGFSWWICRTHGSLPARPLNFSIRKTNPTLILWGLVLVLVTSMVLEPLLDIFPREYLDTMTKSIGGGGWAMLTTIVAAPLLEEILFRGILQQQFTAGYGRIRGVLMAAAVFGIIHVIPQQVVNAFFIGIILGYLYIRSGSLVPSIIIHAINNAIAFIIMQFSKGDMAYAKDLFGNMTFYWIVYGLCCVTFVVAGWNLLRELKRLDETCSKDARAL